MRVALQHVVLIEPPAAQSEHYRQLLEFEGMVVSIVGHEDLHRLPDLAADVVIVNHTRLRRSTLTLVGQCGLRASTTRPLTMALVTAGDELTGVELVEHGLDSFVAIPCGSREFVARVRALLRRSAHPGDLPAFQQPGTQPIRVNGIDIDPARRRVRVRGQDLRLTEQEFQLLYFLAGHPGRVFNRQALLDAVWGNDTFVTTRSVDALVKRVRNQFRAVGREESCVETVRGVGYRLNDRAFRQASAASATDFSHAASVQ